MRAKKTLSLALAGIAVSFLVSAEAFAEGTYLVNWKYSAKSKDAKIKKKSYFQDICTIHQNGTFSSGPIQNGVWIVEKKNKITARIGTADAQRIVERLFPGVPGIVVTDVRQTKAKVKEKIPKKEGKPGKLKFSMKVRVHIALPALGLFDGHMDIKIKFSGLEI